MIRRINNRITKLFTEFTESESFGGIILIICTAISLTLANLPFGENYVHFWHYKISNISIEFIINDGLMAIFFLLISLEIKREIFIGELHDLRRAMLPVIAAAGGMFLPAMIHLIFNYGTSTSSGVGIPMATDIAFSLAVLSLLGKRIPVSLKLFLMALAIIDDLGAILFIAFFYSKEISLLNLGLSLGLFAILMIIQKLKIKYLWLYIVTGFFMWYFMLNSGVHATISGVLLAFTIPFKKGDRHEASSVLQHYLHKPVAYFILPLFALANTAIPFPSQWLDDIASNNSLGIMMGLILGKPVGIVLFSFIGVYFGLCALPDKLKLKHIFMVGIVAGIGFTMSIFMALLAFNDLHYIDSSKIAIILGSFISAVVGYFMLAATFKKSNVSIDQR